MKRTALSSLFVVALTVPVALACEGPPICTVVDPTGTPLNVREEPNGTILGTWDNGVRVRPYESVTHNGKTWRAVERFSDDNAIGWVFDPYLNCAEDGHA
jgi:hypothetical protein